jgi:hypothetical protein
LGSSVTPPSLYFCCALRSTPPTLPLARSTAGKAFFSTYSTQEGGRGVGGVTKVDWCCRGAEGNTYIDLTCADFDPAAATIILPSPPTLLLSMSVEVTDASHMNSSSQFSATTARPLLQLSGASPSHTEAVEAVEAVIGQKTREFTLADTACTECGTASRGLKNRICREEERRGEEERRRGGGLGQVELHVTL